MIHAQHISKVYGNVQAVSDLSLQVARGEIYALLGPNGAGKSTTISMLTTLLRPDTGTIHINGADAVADADAVRRVIGVTFQDLVLDRDLTGRECLDFAGRLYAIPGPARARRIADILERVDLTAAADRLTGTYSGGMKRRLELARCLMMQPLVLFLDEPTQGLDPQNRAQIWDYINDLRRQNGMTVLLTTHAMDEAETLADRVGIIDHGNIVAEGTPAELTRSIGTAFVRVAGAFPAGYQPAFAAAQWVTACDVLPHQLTIGHDHGAAQLAQIIEELQRDGITITDITMSRPTLADVFLQVTGRALRDTGGAV